MRFASQKPCRWMRTGVTRAGSVPVCGIARFDVDGDARVNAAVSTFDQVEEPGLHRPAEAISLLAEGGEGSGVIGFVGDFADQFAVHNTVVFIENDHGACRDAGQRAGLDGNAVGFQKVPAAHG